MKIVLNSESNNFINTFADYAASEGTVVVRAKTEKVLFDEIVLQTPADVFIIEGHKPYAQRAVDYLRRKHPNLPISILLVTPLEENSPWPVSLWPTNASYYMFNPSYIISAKDIYHSVEKTLESYKATFEKLLRITVTIKDKIEFGPCVYDPTRRTFHFKGNLIKRMSTKEGGVLEVLSSNYGTVVKKELIMEKVWHDTSFFVSRSMDVYVTNLRKLFKTHDIPMVINSISGAGLILEHQ